MKKILFFVALLFLPLAVSAESLPAYPMLFWGNVTINGTAAPVGTVVSAYYGSTLAGQATIKEAGVYGYAEATKQKLLISEGTGKITFKFQSSAFNSGTETGGTTAQEYSGFVSGKSENKNLAFVLTTTTPPPTGGGGGDGGGTNNTNNDTPSNNIVTPTAPTNQTVKKSNADISGDGVVDLMDFNLLMVNWGKQGVGIKGDINGDNVVDLLDFNLLLVNWTI